MKSYARFLAIISINKGFHWDILLRKYDTSHYLFYYTFVKEAAIYRTFVRRMRKNVRYCFDENHDERACCRNWKSHFHLLFAVVLRNWAGPLFLPWVCGTCNQPKHFGWRGKSYVNKHSNGYTMHKDGNNFRKLWMTTAGNLSVEIRYQKLKVNFNYCFRHGIFQNQVYNFFCIISWVVLYSSFIVRFVCFSSQNFLSFECFWKIRFLLYRF